jgi:nucleoid DNA-binding protein
LRSFSIMQDYIQKYLSHNREVVVSGLGAFKVIKNTPEWQAVPQQFVAPTTDIVWTASSEATTEQFINYIAQTKKISLTSAIDFINNEIAIMGNLIDKNGFDEWIGLGTFKRDTLRKITFVPNETLQYSKMVAAEKVIRKNEVHTMTVGEQETTNTAMEAFYSEPEKKPFKWWLWPLIIGVGGIAYILYYYFVYKN